MDNGLKNILGIVSVIALLVFSYGTVRVSSSYSKSVQPGSFKSFAVTGEGKVVAIPDVAEFNATVITEGGNDLGTLQKENITKTNKIIAYLKEAKIDSKDIKTTNFSVEPRYQYYGCNNGGACPPPTITGYTVRQTISVKVRDFKIAGDLLSGAVKNGANSVTNLNFTIENRDKIVNDAKAQAITKAKERARAMAKAGGFRLGSLISIDDNGGFAPAPMMAYGRGGAEDSSLKSQANVVPTIEPGSQEVTETVTLRYEIR